MTIFSRPPVRQISHGLTFGIVLLVIQTIPVLAPWNRSPSLLVCHGPSFLARIIARAESCSTYTGNNTKQLIDSAYRLLFRLLVPKRYLGFSTVMLLFRSTVASNSAAFRIDMTESF